MAKRKPEDATRVHDHAVTDGEIHHLSVSQITTFDPTQYGGCNHRWWRNKVERREHGGTLATELGVTTHGMIENYYEKNEPTLPDIVRVGARFLPEPGPDLLIEEGFDTEDMALTAAGVPLVGYIDLVHRRNTWIDNLGKTRLMPPHSAEVVDWKTTSDIDKYAKTDDDLEHTVQMVGYAEWASRKWPDIEIVRVSHGYFQTRGAKRAEKRTALLPLTTIKARWHSIEATVREMVDVARERDPEHVPRNWASCGAYRGCPYQSLCPRTPQKTMKDLFVSMGEVPAPPTMERKPMSLLSRSNGTTPATKPAEPTTPPVKRSLLARSTSQANTPSPEVLAEMERLKAEEAKAKAPATTTVTPLPDGKHPVTACDVGKFYMINGFRCKFAGVSTLPDGRKLYLFDHPTMPTPVTFEAHGWVDGEAPSVPGVLPPDAPKSDPKQAALPLTGEMVKTVAPAIVAAAAGMGLTPTDDKKPDDNKASDTKTDDSKGTDGKKCPASASRVALVGDEAVNREKVCPAEGCGKTLKIRPAKEGDTWVATLPKHDKPTPVVLDSKEPAPKSAAEAQEPAPTTKEAFVEDVKKLVSETVNTILQAGTAGAPVKQTITLETHVTPPEGVTPLPVSPSRFLFVDCAVEGMPTFPLEPYIAAKCAEIAKAYDAVDIRCGSNESPLGYNRWRGVLAACVRDDLPPSGSYTLMGVRESEIKSIVVEALSPYCSAIVRGMH